MFYPNRCFFLNLANASECEVVNHNLTNFATSLFCSEPIPSPLAMTLRGSLKKEDVAACKT